MTPAKPNISGNICFACGHHHHEEADCHGRFDGTVCPSCGEVEIPDHFRICYGCQVNKPACDNCGSLGANPCVREQDISGPGEPAYDAPVKVGNLCPTCREEDDADLLSDWQ